MSDRNIVTIRSIDSEGNESRAEYSATEEDYGNGATSGDVGWTLYFTLKMFHMGSAFSVISELLTALAQEDEDPYEHLDDEENDYSAERAAAHTAIEAAREWERLRTARRAALRKSQP